MSLSLEGPAAVKAHGTEENKAARLWLAAFIILMLPFCFLGYGPDNDTYGVIDSGRVTWLQHGLQTSRNPGYWAYEAVILVLSQIGGFVLTNLVTLAVSAVLLWRFYTIAGRLGVRFRLLLTACLAVIPAYFVASTSTIDYLWSMLGLLLMMECIVADRWGWAATAGTFAYLIRSSNSTVIMGLILGGVLGELYVSRRFTARALKILAVGATAAVLGSLPFIASYRAAGNSMAFREPMIGPPEMWTPKMRVGRFLYKTILLFSLPGWVVLVWSLFSRKPEQQHVIVAPEVSAYRKRMIPMLVGGVIMNALLFFMFSVEISYLLPGSAFLLLLLGIDALAKTRTPLFALVTFLLVANVVTLQLAQPNIPARSTSAKFHLGLQTGPTIEATQNRWDLRHCESNDCWKTVMHSVNGMPPGVQ